VRVVKTILSLILSFYLFLLLVIAIAPKENIYFLLEQQLNKNKVIISEESFNDKLLSIDLNSLNIYYDDIFVSYCKNINIDMFLLYNSVKLETIKIDKRLKKLALFDIQSIQIVYSIFNPLNILIDANSDIGNFYGKISLFDRVIKVIYKPNKNKSINKNIIKKFKKVNGEYIYEKAI